MPLVGAEQNAVGMPPLPTRQPSGAINDIGKNNRAKLYALCTKIGKSCKNKLYIKSVLGFQSICVPLGLNYPIDSMNSEEKITMCIIENYLSFKVMI